MNTLHNELYSQPYDPAHMEPVTTVLYSVKNNRIVARKISSGGLEVVEFVFDQQEMANVIENHIEIQFALYQFYVMSSDYKDTLTRSNEKISCGIHYPNKGDKLKHSTLSNLLSIFDSLIVVYQKNKAKVSGILSSLDSKTTIYRLYHSLYIDSRLNPFIISFIDHTKGCKLEDGATEVYRFQPREDDVQAAVLDHTEMEAIHYLEQQLQLSDECFTFVCLGWNEEDVAESTTLIKLAKYFERIYVVSTQNRFRSQLLAIYKK
ncbi:hypothetical protein [Paenibacillus sp. FSL R5-0810]|uniref:hypothetical protein n=1 Tax=Paenibacillus sp. FSL R5-0810 TaxID=2921659 RepID=UPI0030FA7B62